ncbi:MAG: glycerate kinase [Opitutaceae bacterium]|nr:glycerate kinase [Cephaloticoccus sp.]MCP5530436.1 glycerate kinase [Opitutaceae bacterium]
MRVLLAFDKFKDSFSAREAGRIVARVLREEHPDWIIELAPITDGGEGFANILTHSVRGELRQASVHGPGGEMLVAEYGMVDFDRIPVDARRYLDLPTATQSGARIAIIEMALASGLALLHPADRDPWHTTTLGTGELIRRAMEEGAAGILLGVGGSATHDLGLGALSALGFEFQTAEGARVVPPVPATWKDIVTVSGAILLGLPPLRIACDVSNPLLGEHGAAAVYGPQKGLRTDDLERVESESARMGALLTRHCDQEEALMNEPGTGAAGGIAFGLMAAAGARLLSGSDLVGAWLALESKIKQADIVITGEGRFDESSFCGKGPGTVVAQALAGRKQVHVFAGKIEAGEHEGVKLHAITPDELTPQQALLSGPENLEAAVRRIFSPSPLIR